MKKVKAIVISGNGTNCEIETAHACRLGGADVVDIVHISELIYGMRRLDDYHFLSLPGGFLDGDDLGGGKVGANRIRYARVRSTGEPLIDQLYRFISEGKLIIAICNGFQMVVKLGLLPGFDGDYDTQLVTLTFNDSGRFEDRWVYLKVNQDSRCVFTRGLQGLMLPVRHGEGKFVTRDKKIRRRLFDENLVVVQYSDPHYSSARSEYPLNPNGSEDAIAGICDPTGRLFGFMPHPEAYLHYTNHPMWTRKSLPEEGMGVTIFRNAVNFIRNEVF